MTEHAAAGTVPAASGPAAGNGAWAVEIRRDDDAFEALKDEWDPLYAACLTATPFQSWGWLAAWWRSYGVPGALRLVLVRHAGELVAALPLMVRRRYGMRVLVPVGDPESDHIDLLADGRCTGEALPYLAEGLSRSRGWAAVDLPDVRPAALAWRLAARWPDGRVRRLPSSICMQVPFRSTDDYVAALPAARRKKMRRAWRKAGSLGLATSEVPPDRPDRIESAVADLLRLHEMQWRDRGGNPEHQRPRFACHLANALAVMVPAGQATLMSYAVGDDVVGVQMILLGHDMAAGYLYGIDPQARAELDFMPLFLTRLTERAEHDGCTTISLLRGAEPHKEYWRFERVDNERLLLLGGRCRFTAAVYGLILRSRSATVTLIKSRLPGLHSLLRRTGRSLPAGGGDHTS